MHGVVWCESQFWFAYVTVCVKTELGSAAKCRRGVWSGVFEYGRVAIGLVNRSQYR